MLPAHLHRHLQLVLLRRQEHGPHYPLSAGFAKGTLGAEEAGAEDITVKLALHMTCQTGRALEYVQKAAEGTS